MSLLERSLVLFVAGLDVGQEEYHVVLTRRGVTNDAEKSTTELSRNIQYCAFLVDEAAKSAGISRSLARQLALCASYERALEAATQDQEDGERDEAFIPEKAPMLLLLESIGSHSTDQVSSVINLLGTGDQAEKKQMESFAVHLHSLCRHEHEWRSQPIKIWLTIF